MFTVLKGGKGEKMLSDNRQDLMDGALGGGGGGENVRWGQSRNLYIFNSLCSKPVPSSSLSSTWKLVRNAESQAHPRTTESESAF